MNEKNKNKNKTTPEAQTASRSSKNFEEKYDTVLTVSSHLKRQSETASWIVCYTAVFSVVTHRSWEERCVTTLQTAV